MRKDWTIIRQILLRLEESATPNTGSPRFQCNK